MSPLFLNQSGWVLVGVCRSDMVETISISDFFPPIEAISDCLNPVWFQNEALGFSTVGPVTMESAMLQRWVRCASRLWASATACPRPVLQWHRVENQAADHRHGRLRACSDRPIHRSRSHSKRSCMMMPPVSVDWPRPYPGTKKHHWSLRNRST